ncbi:MAG: hypothetical protein CL946_04080, partial [Ectothiorhodospiraceae bacterium]|nr:hypothetical protein [Ectothiorhodospiraceae bacterium]
MLNYIWLGLVAIGILTAAGRDIYNETTNRYANGDEWEIIASEDIDDSVSDIQHGSVLLSPPAQIYQDTLRFQADVRNVRASKRRISLLVTDAHPPAVKEIAEAQGDGDKLAGYAEYRKGAWRFTHDEVRFVWMKRITNATLEAAELAVTIAIGLIGIMALWLGVMKVG